MEIVAFIPFSKNYWHGKTTTVVFAPNCNFRCPYCYNYALVLFPNKLPRVEEDKFFSELKENAPSLDGVCVTGGEPTLQAEKLVEFLEQVKLLGLETKIETNGSNPSVLKKLIEKQLVDFVCLDVKHVLKAEQYFSITAKNGFLSSIKQSIEALKSSSIEYEFTTTYVPGIHSEEDIMEIASNLNGAKRFILQSFKQNSGTLDKKFSSKLSPQHQLLEKIAKKINGIEEVRIKSTEREQVIKAVSQ